MVRRGSTVRVRQRAFTKTPQNATFHLILHLHGSQPDRVWSTFWNTRSLDQRRTPRPEPRITSLRESSSSATRSIGRFSQCIAVTGRYPVGQEILSAILSAPETTSGLPKEARLPGRRRVEVTRKRCPVTGACSPVSLRLAQSQELHLTASPPGKQPYRVALGGGR